MSCLWGKYFFIFYKKTYEVSMPKNKKAPADSQISGGFQ
jgi:hypothetical protein